MSHYSILLIQSLTVSLSFIVLSVEGDTNVKRELNDDVIFNLLSGKVDWTSVSTILKGVLLFDVPESSRLCLSDISRVANATFHLEEWALTMLDTFGKPGSGILDGNFILEGNFKECIKIKKDNISGKYCRAEISPDTLFSLAANYLNTTIEQSSIKSTGVSLKAAICIPNSCATEIGKLASLIKEKLGFFALDLPQIEIKCVESPLKDLPNDTMALIAIAVLSMFILLVIIGTCLELKIENQDRSLNNNVLVYFSAYSNGKKLFQCKHEKHSFLEINGLKVLAMSMVIYTHSWNKIRPITDDPFESGQYFGHFLPQFLLALLSVDVFFAITGFLTLNSILHKNFKGKLSNLRFTFNYVIERYLRLAVIPGIYLLIFYTGLPYYLSSGPYWKNVEPHIFTDWGRNLLFICNWSEGYCPNVWWFMSVSMQLHVLSLFIVVPIINKKYWLSVLNGGAILVSSWCWIFWTAYQNDTPPNYSLLQNRKDIFTYIRLLKPFIDDLYTSPFYHYGSYCSGMLGRWILFRYKDRIIFNKVQLYVSWLVWSVIVFILLSFRYYEPNKFVKSVHMMLGTTIMGLCVAWLLVVCLTNNGGIVSAILRWKLLVFLSKLTMTVYLTHMLIINHFYSSEEALIHFSGNLLFAFFLRHWLVSYVIAILVSLIIESPMDLIINLVRNRFLST